jgi:drug/metabolite transporter (DMT)-like permease
MAQMLWNGLVFLLLSSVMAPGWRLPAPGELLLLALVGMVGFTAQYLLYEGLRLTPASVAAPLEYTGLLWAFVLGYLIWDDVPSALVFWGAALIALSGLFSIAMEWRQARDDGAIRPGGVGCDNVAVPSETPG